MVQLDLILPPIIVGMLIIIIFRVNAFMMDSSIDNRIFNDMQNFAETTAVVLDDKLRTAKMVFNTTDFEDDDICENFRKQDGTLDTNCSSVLTYITTNNYKVTIEEIDDDDTVKISSIEVDGDGNEIGTLDEIIYPLYVSKLEFQYKTSDPNFIRYKIETESDPDHHVQNKSDQKTVKGFAERKLFLRNLAI